MVDTVQQVAATAAADVAKVEAAAVSTWKTKIAPYLTHLLAGVVGYLTAHWGLLSKFL